MWDLIQIAKEASACDSLAKKEAHDFDVAKKTLAAQDSVMIIRSRQVAIIKSDAKNWEDRFHNQEGLTKIQKKRKHTWLAVSGGLLLLLVYTNLP